MDICKVQRSTTKYADRLEGEKELKFASLIRFLVSVGRLFEKKIEWDRFK
jgi:hypothetical protein